MMKILMKNLLFSVLAIIAYIFDLYEIVFAIFHKFAFITSTICLANDTCFTVLHFTIITLCLNILYNIASFSYYYYFYLRNDKQFSTLVKSHLIKITIQVNIIFQVIAIFVYILFVFQRVLAHLDHTFFYFISTYFNDDIGWSIIHYTLVVLSCALLANIISIDKLTRDEESI